jgi:hypothetical protein
MLTSKEKKDIKKIKGKIRGAAFNTDIEYIKSKESEKGLDKALAEMRKQEPEFEPQKIKNTEWYPLKWRILFLLTTEKIFDWDENDIFQMGRQAPINSFIVRMVLRYFNLFKKTCEEAPTYWKKHYSVGELEMAEYNAKEKYVIFRLKKFKIHPHLCIYLKGYFLGMAELTNKSEKIEIKETKCAFRGDSYHEYIINWK